MKKYLIPFTILIVIFLYFFLAKNIYTDGTYMPYVETPVFHCRGIEFILSDKSTVDGGRTRVCFGIVTTVLE